jgi:hypothetical protein
MKKDSPTSEFHPQLGGLMGEASPAASWKAKGVHIYTDLLRKTCPETESSFFFLGLFCNPPLEGNNSPQHTTSIKR